MRSTGTRLNLEVALTYELGPQRLALLALVAARVDGQDVLEDELNIENATLHRLPGEHGLGQRVWAKVNCEVMRLRYRATVDVVRQAQRLESLSASPLTDVPAEIISYLRPSRFCQSDMFEAFASRRFGHLDGGDKVAAIRDWITAQIEYVPGASGPHTTLLETFAERRGVCRDFAHVMCGLARASQIPARYVSAYGANVDPQDFHAVVEVWLDGGWHIVDPSGMCAADELVVVGVGRDAADVPFMETPDTALLRHQAVKVTSEGMR